MTHNFYRTHTGSISNETTLMERPSPSLSIKRESNYKIQDLNDIIDYIDELIPMLDKDIKRCKDNGKSLSKSKDIKFYTSGIFHLTEKI